MPPRVPNLFGTEQEARRLYQLFLAHLGVHGLHGRVVQACRLIRRHATARHVDPEQSAFTFAIEIDALCALRKYRAAWRRLRRYELLAFGRRLDLHRHRWKAADSHWLSFYCAPLLFFLGRYRLGCLLMEKALRFGLKYGNRSYDWWHHVSNTDPWPVHIFGVTLKHFYDRLGRSLGEWRDWRRFIKGLHPRLFRLAGITREELLDEPARLGAMTERLATIVRERTTSGVTRGQRDLIQSAAAVRRWQEETKKKLRRFKVRIRPVQTAINLRLRELFPELGELPQ